jgi:hypothetical protein
MDEENQMVIRIDAYEVEFDKSLIPVEWSIEKTPNEIKFAEAHNRDNPFAAISITKVRIDKDKDRMKAYFKKELREYQRLGSLSIANFSDPKEEQIGKNRWWVIEGTGGAGAVLWLHEISDTWLLQALVVFSNLDKKTTIENLIKSIKKINPDQ